MKHPLSLILFGFIFLTFLSCTGSKMLMKELARYPQPLGYSLVSPVAMNVKTDSVIVTFTGFALDSLTTVKRKRFLVLPFVFVNIVETRYRIKLGSNLMQGNFNDFFFNAMLDESQRSGEFALCYDSACTENAYNLEVTLDTCLTDTQLGESSLLIFYVNGYDVTTTESSYPTTSKVACTARLRKGDQILRDTTFSVTKNLAFNGGDDLARWVRIQRTADCMVENLCQSTRDLLSTMVKDVNTTLAAQKR